MVISHQHTEQARRDTLIPYLTKEVIETVLGPTGLLNEKKPRCTLIQQVDLSQEVLQGTLD